MYAFFLLSLHPYSRNSFPIQWFCTVTSSNLEHTPWNSPSENRLIDDQSHHSFIRFGALGNEREP